MPKTKAQKGELFAAYKDVVQKGNFIVIETDKVPASVVTGLRKVLAGVEAKLYVIKNTVFSKASAEHEGLAAQQLTGQLSVIEGGKDLVLAAKAIEEATKQAKAELSLTGVDEPTMTKYKPFQFKFGFINGTVLSQADVIRLSQLPDKKTVMAQFVGTLAAPISGFMNVMMGVPRKFVYALNDLQNKKA